MAAVTHCVFVSLDPIPCRLSSKLVSDGSTFVTWSNSVEKTQLPDVMTGGVMGGCEDCAVGLVLGSADSDGVTSWALCVSDGFSDGAVSEGASVSAGAQLCDGSFSANLIIAPGACWRAMTR